MLQIINELISEKITGEWGVDPTSDSKVFVLRTTNFTNEGRLNLANVVTRDIEAKKVEKKRLVVGDIIIEKSGGSPKQPVGRVVYFDESEGTYLCNNFTSILRASDKVLPKYLFYSLFYKHLSHRTLGYQNKTTGIINLQLDRYLKNESVSVPDKQEQQRIIDILDEAVTLRQKRKASIKLLDDYLESVFFDIFQTSDSSQYKFLEDIASKDKHAIKAGPFGSSLKKEFYVDKGYKIYGQEQVIRDDFSYGDYYITEEKYRSLESCKVQAGDILISLVGTFGKISVVPDEYEPGIINPRLMKITINQEIIHPVVLRDILKSSYVQRQIRALSHGGTMSIVNVGIMKKIKLPIPLYSAQLEYLLIRNQVTRTRAKMLSQSEELDNQFNSLLQTAFSA